MNNFLSYIPEEWLITRGRGAKIGICDTGCNVAHTAIRHAIKEYRNFGEQNNNDHGTHVAGIIVSKTNNIKSIRGLANESDVYVANISAARSKGYSSLCEALKWMDELNIDVLNLSLAYLMSDEEIYECIKKISRTTLILSAHSIVLPYPHSYSETISVGVEGNEVELITEGEFVSSCKDEYFKRMTGTSMATAYASSVACLARAYDKKIDKQYFLSVVRGDKKIDPKKISLSYRSGQMNFRFGQ